MKFDKFVRRIPLAGAAFLMILIGSAHAQEEPAPEPATDAAETAQEEAAPCAPQWSTMAGTTGTDAWVYTMYVWDDGNGPQLYAGGYFAYAGGRVAQGVAKWDGYNWRPLGDGIKGMVMAIKNFDDGEGDALYVGGMFYASGELELNNLAKWDPRTRTWSDVGGGVDNAVIALATYDDGETSGLFVGGTFRAAGGKPAGGVARWDGKEWNDLDGGMDDGVRAFAVFDRGDGPELFAGGIFSQAGGEPASRLARWNGKRWKRVSGEFDGHGIRTMKYFDNALYVGGVIRSIDGVLCNNVARWDPKSDTWSNLSTGANERVVHLESFDDGSGELLYVVGWFTTMGDKRVERVAKWDGQEWSPLPAPGFNTVARAMARFPDTASGREALYIGGGFRFAGRERANHVAAWVGCREAPKLTPSDEPLGEVVPEGERVQPTRDGRGRGEAPTRRPQPGIRERPGVRDRQPVRERPAPRREPPPADDPD